MQSNRSGLLSRKKSLILVLLFLVVLSSSTVFAQDRFIIGTGDANNTVIDKNTGLMWERSPVCWDGGTDYLSYTEASAHCLDLNGLNGRGGYEDWRLPTIAELVSLVDYRFYNPALPNSAGTAQMTLGDPFYCIVGNESVIFPAGIRAWSSTHEFHFWRNNWYLDVKYGDGAYMDSIQPSGFAWCVRGNMSSSENCILQTSCPSVDCPSYPECKENECPVCQTCLNEKKIVYLNNCTEKNLSVQSSFQNNSQVSGETNESVLDEDKNIGLIVTFIIMGLIIVCLILSTFYFYKKSRSE